MIAARLGRMLAVLFGIYSLLVAHNLFQAALAVFIYFAASAEEAHVLYEDRRRRYSGGADQGQGQGIWVAPAGHHWVDQGDGIWRLAPIVVRPPDPRWDAPSWR
jgi:hypothetical protein